MLATIVALLSVVEPRPVPEPEPTPTPRIIAAAGDIEILGEAPPDVVERLRSQLSTFLRDTYEQAFLARQIELAEEDEDEPVETAATPTPGPQLTDSFTTEAGRAMSADEAVFRRPTDVDLHGGRVAFDGVATLDEAGVVSTYLEITFTARGTSTPPPENGPPRAVRLSQRGHLLLTDDGEGLLVAGYGLELEDRREVDEAPSRALAQARWMP